MQIITNHLGYEKDSFKKAIINTGKDINLPIGNLIDATTDEKVWSGEIQASGKVEKWRNMYFHFLDFSSFQEEGIFYIEIPYGKQHFQSSKFKISPQMFHSETVSNILFYLKAQRCSGRHDHTDRKIPFFGKRNNIKDVHGGWYDASGDVSKYLSHLSYANYFNPQQTPMVIWHLLALSELFPADKSKEYTFLNMRIVDEATHGGDFLMRMQDPEGYFYMTVFDRWSKQLSERVICSYEQQTGILSEKYQAGYRQGGGLAIAALARLSQLETFGNYSSSDYLEAAKNGFSHLESNNKLYLDDGKENIIDDYCALLASTELGIATGEAYYLNCARQRAHNLKDRLMDSCGYSGWWSADDKKQRPYYHAAEAGLPVIALSRFLVLEKDKDSRNEILMAIKKSLSFELSITSEVNNPFGYARQLICRPGQKIQSSFFMPHSNETGYWWQGENARLASLAAAALNGTELLKEDIEFADKLKNYAINQLDWIAGLNPFDVCMIFKAGHNSADYIDFVPNVPFGICNGITSGLYDEEDIDFRPDIKVENWRWSEQWLLHASWFLYAVGNLSKCLYD